MTKSGTQMCRQCEADLKEDFAYCPRCGERRSRRVDILYGATILYVFSLLLAISLGCVGYQVFDTHAALAGVLFAVAAALGPVAVVGIIYDRLIRHALRDAAITSFSELSRTVCSQSITKLEDSQVRMGDITQRLLHIRDVGLIAAFPERRFAFSYIADAIRAEQKEIYIVGTSFRGLIAPGPGDEVIMQAIMERVKDPKCRVRFLLTHPAFAHLRQKLEGIQRLEEFHIAQEIFETVVELRKAGVHYQNIRFVKATPTVFGVMTSKVMLLNPYPYQGQAFGSVTFLFDARNSENGVYRAFNASHFQGVWEGANVAKLASYQLDVVEQLFRETLETLNLAKSDKTVHFGGWDNSEPVAKSAGCERTPRVAQSVS